MREPLSVDLAFEIKDAFFVGDVTRKAREIQNKKLYMARKERLLSRIPAQPMTEVTAASQQRAQLKTLR